MLPVRLSRRRRHQLLGLAVVAAGIGYFGYHAIYGRTGYVAWMTLRAEATRLEGELERARARNAQLEADLAGLRPDSLDPDAVETALRDLGYIRPHERVVLRRAAD